MSKRIIWCVTVLILTACSTSEFTVHPAEPLVQNSAVDLTTKKNIIVFFDGTSNTPNSRTNIEKLHNLITLQDRQDIHSIYVKGVGTEGGPTKVLLGMATGLGIGEDVRQAYRYLANTYREQSKDKIFLFGFSRGAYSARILAGLIHTAGLPSIAHLSEEEQISLIDKIYSTYKGTRDKKYKTDVKKRGDAIKQISSINLVGARRRNMPGKPNKLTRVYSKALRPLVYAQPRISFMGLWDTVEALGLPNRKEMIERVNDNYIDQLCNIDQAAHALSVDDNRAKIFTPIALTAGHLVESCENEVVIDDIVEEVWFAGAHADVGGGYEDTNLSGESLNWMIGEIESFSLLPDNTKVIANPYGRSHDPSAGFFDLIYENRNRNLPVYIEDTKYNDGIIKLHKSLIERLAKNPKKGREFVWIAKGSKEKKYTRNYPSCFDVHPVDGGNSYTLTLTREEIEAQEAYEAGGQTSPRPCFQVIK